MTRAAFLNFSWLGVAPQTRIGMEQTKASSDGVHAFVGGLSGVAAVGQGLSLTLVNGALQLSAAPPTIQPPTPQSARIYGEVLTASAANPLQYPLSRPSRAGTLVLWMNGIRIAAPIDYTVLGPNLIQLANYYQQGRPQLPLVADYDPV